MDIEDYFKRIDSIAKECISEEASIEEYIENATGTTARLISKLIQFRRDMLDGQDQKYVQGFLSVGYFEKYGGLDRIACFALYSDILRCRDQILAIDHCKKYELDQPLFKESPKLFEFVRQPERELIDFSVLNQVGGSEIVQFEGIYAKLDGYLLPSIVNWSDVEFPDSSIFIRLNPERVYHKEPLKNMMEEVLIPANPKWWRNLELYKNKKTGAQYIGDSGPNLPPIPVETIQ